VCKQTVAFGLVCMAILACSKPITVERIGPSGIRETLVIMKGASEGELFVTSIALPRAQMVISRSGLGLSSKYIISSLAGKNLVEVAEIGSSGIGGSRKFFARSLVASEYATVEVLAAASLRPTTVRVTPVSPKGTAAAVVTVLGLVSIMINETAEENQCCEQILVSSLWQELYPPGAYAFAIAPYEKVVFTDGCKVWVSKRYDRDPRSGEEIRDLCDLFEDCEAACQGLMWRIEGALPRTAIDNIVTNEFQLCSKYSFPCVAGYR